MRLHIKILGIIYCAIGALIGLFLLLVLVMQALESLGITKSNGKSPGLAGALSIVLLLSSIGLWFIQTGVGLSKFNKGARFYAVYFFALPLLIVLNTILLLTKDRPGTVGAGWIVFHFFMIAVGIYTLIVLLPGWGREEFQ
jgi:hypothetical protein